MLAFCARLREDLHGQMKNAGPPRLPYTRAVGQALKAMLKQEDTVNEARARKRWRGVSRAVITTFPKAIEYHASAARARQVKRLLVLHLGGECVVEALGA